ncbi:MAG: alpha/beta fold hydrolase, partial [Actinomycetota bacterium]|nr:alpha/beta fold hydrolase [Actinomycetota bacterium]
MTNDPHVISFRNPAGLRLAGDLWPAGTDAIVLAHGFASDRRSRGRFPYLAQRLVAAGYTALAFDFAGCGESDDTVLTLESQVADLRAAVRYLRS